MEIKKAELKAIFEEEGYYISDYILAKTYIAVKHFLDDISVGQKVYSTCLDGPSGAGKTHFVDTYCTVISRLLKRRVRFINFQLDAETGKSELYEDIDVVATLEHDPTKVRLPGKIIEAINAVNKGEYVILKMDEYDKARDVTDTFFNNFLQEALVNTTQHGDVAVNNETGGKLQVFLCKNDQRAELSEPMMRRNRMIRLDYMKPERLYKILVAFASKYKSPAEIVNMVSLFYEEMYQNKELYNKLPSCSECQQAIIDAQILLSDTEFTQNDIYTNVIENMLKMPDDIKTFESILSKHETDSQEKLNNFVNKMKATDITETAIQNIRDAMVTTVFEEKCKELQNKISELQQLISKYREKFSDMEKKRQAVINAEIDRLSLQKGELVGIPYIPSATSNFEDESLNIKRGHNIFELSESGWTDVAKLHISKLSHSYFIAKVLENINVLGVTVYENGILLRADGDLKLIVIRDNDKDNSSRYRLMTSHSIIPSTYLESIVNFFEFAALAYDKQPKTTDKQKDNSAALDLLNSYYINALVYNDDDSLATSFESIDENIYYVETTGLVNETTEYNEIIPPVICDDPEKAVIASKKIMAGHEKVKTNE